MRLRRTAAAVTVSVAALLSSHCGFELRRAPELQFSTVQLKGFKDASPLARELRRTLAASRTTQVVESAAAAQVVLEALGDEREKSVVASTASGQVREVQLRARFRFSVRSARGQELLPATEIVLSRDMSYNESNALAKEQEEALLYAAMQNDIVAQVMRRLAAVAL
jgi:LPS-assembly lipoprotein